MNLQPCTVIYSNIHAMHAFIHSPTHSFIHSFTNSFAWPVQIFWYTRTSRNPHSVHTLWQPQISWDCLGSSSRAARGAQNEDRLQIPQLLKSQHRHLCQLMVRALCRINIYGWHSIPYPPRPTAYESATGVIPGTDRGRGMGRERERER